MLHARVGNHTIITNGINGAVPGGAERLLQGRAYRLPNAHPVVGDLAQDGVRDYTALASKVAQLRDGVSAQFQGLYEMADIVATGLACGEHVLFLGPVGNGKSTIARLFAEGIGGSFFRVVMNPDLPREAVFGAMDPKAMQEGRWERRWAGLARADIALLDELGKASPQVANMMLDALEERRVSAGGETQIPLLTAIAGSNESLPKEMAAIYDRLLLRLSPPFIRDTAGFIGMLTKPGGAVPVGVHIQADEVRLLSAAVESLTLDQPADGALTQGMVPLFDHFSRDYISPRRWRNTRKAAVAAAVLEGVKPDVRHLSAARWTLWHEADEEAAVRDAVLGLTDPMASRVLALESDWAVIVQAVLGLTAQTDSNMKLATLRKVRDMAKEAGDLVQQSGAYRQRVGAVAQAANAKAQELVATL